MWRRRLAQPRARRGSLADPTRASHPYRANAADRCLRTCRRFSRAPRHTNPPPLQPHAGGSHDPLRHPGHQPRLHPRRPRDDPADKQLEAAINEADKLDLIDPEALRAAVQTLPRRPGLATRRRTLDRHTFRLTDSELERCFLPIVRRAGLPPPLTQQRVNGYRVDFYWPELDLVVETDGLRYHRTPAQQTADHRRDQAHAAAGVERLRFSRAQVRYEPVHVERTLHAVAERLRL